MFDVGRYNVGRYNVRVQEGDEVRLVATMALIVRAMAGGGEDIQELMFAGEQVLGHGQGAAGAHEALALGVEAGASAVGYPVFLVREKLIAEAGGAARMIVWCYPGGEWMAGVDGAVSCGGELTYGLDLGGGLAARAVYAAECHMEPLWADEGFFAQVTTRLFHVEEAFFDLVIPPGATLVVDSGGYVVLLDGENVIARQKGAWLWLDRDVAEVVLDVAGGRRGDLAVEMLYQVKWL